jgi:hypothetical protein
VVVQGLSEVPLMDDVSRWRVFTIGTAFGNAFSPTDVPNRTAIWDQGPSEMGIGKARKTSLFASDSRRLPGRAKCGRRAFNAA